MLFNYESDNEDIKKLIDRFSLLLEVNASINSTLNLDELLRKILNVATIVVQAEASSLALVDHNTNELVFNIAQGEAGQTIQTLRIPVGQGIAGWVAKYGVSLNIQDARQDPRFWRGSDDETKFVTKAVICVPLMRNERVIGILEALNKLNDGVFNEEDMLLFESLGNIAAIAIENSQLYILLNQQLTKLSESNQRLEGILQQLKSSEDEINKLREFVGNKGTLEGKLEVFAPENLMQMLANDYKTGKLLLKDDQVEGSLYFLAGKIYHAVLYKDSGQTISLKGLNALYDLLCIRSGVFSFNENEKIEDKTVEGGFMNLIIEGLRRLDEFIVLSQKYPMLNKPQIIGNPDTESLDDNKKSIINFINGQNTIKDILKRVKLDRFTVMSLIDELKQSSIVNISNE